MLSQCYSVFCDSNIPFCLCPFYPQDVLAILSQIQLLSGEINLYELKTYHEVIDEIYYKVSHLEPWEKGSRKTAGQTGMCGGVRGVGAGGIVSSAFCLLYKLFTLRLTKKQVIGLITHRDSPYIRALGFMYIRFTQPPQELWDWFEAYLDDEEGVALGPASGSEEASCTSDSRVIGLLVPKYEAIASLFICTLNLFFLYFSYINVFFFFFSLFLFLVPLPPFCFFLPFSQEIDVKAGGGHSMTIGEMLRHWFTKLEWYSTLFPRIPVPTQKDLDEKLKARALSKAQDGKPVGPLPVICNGDEGMEEEAEEWNEEEPNAAVDVGSKGSRSPERRRYDRSCDKSTPHRSPQSRKSPDRHRSSHSPHRRKSPRHRSPHHRKSSPPPLSSSHRKLSPSSGHSKYSSSYSSSAQHSSSMDDFAVELARERERQRRERERDCNGKPKDHHHHHHRHHHHHHRHRHHHSTSSSKSKDKEPGGVGKNASFVKEKHQSTSRSPNRSRSHEKNHSKRSHSKEHKHSKAPSMLSTSSKHKKRSRSKSVEERPSGDGGNKNHKSRSHHKKDHSQDASIPSKEKFTCPSILYSLLTSQPLPTPFLSFYHFLRIIIIPFRK
ncbi:PRPF38B [Acanthosepion pharaonis]|uniref:PRPF38B n=1 Tax=Acanthosepion pharaonis TaxID=158019 RepID=A0A812DYK9_ACAPH|nr:PRPF38B [Sepia pharaonis]